MKRLGKLFRHRLFLGFLGVVFLSLFIWFAGPMLGFNQTSPLESKYSRWMAIGALSSLWFLMALVRFVRSRIRNAKMLDSLATREVSANESASAEELQILQSKMEQAVDTLKSKNFSRTGGSRFIYELPWYVIIGPPGAGKTTLLSNSGLDFPLEETHGRSSIKGLGGTRNCDWWFTDQAVLLDTAGRYSTQDSEKEVDKSAWTGFLSMLREKRSRRPINGVLLALSIEDILTGSEAEIEQVARTLRNRIEELYKQLGIAPPVYLMFTKCDLLAGFTQYFGDLDKQSREQVWGHTLGLDDKEHSAILNEGIHALSEQLNKQTVGKLHAELSQKNREDIYGFPLQFNHARKQIEIFIQSLTAQSRLLQPVMFRGVYFTSATQSGSVFDQVIKNVSQSFGISAAPVSQAGDKGRSYFIKNLLSDVVFSESGLAGTNLVTEKRLKRLQWGIAAGVATLAIGLLAFWSTSYVQNKRLIERVDVASQQLKQSVENLDPNSIDLFTTNDVLSEALSLASINTADSPHSGLLIKRAGLYQGDKISELATTKYDELLLDILLPRLMVRLENQMHARNTDSEFLFEALKTYQMIGDRERFDSDVVTGWFNYDFNVGLPVETSAQVRSQLKTHVARLFNDRPRRLSRPLDNSIISQYQQIAANTSLPQRAYNRIRNAAQSDINSFVKLTTMVGPELPGVFTRQDGVSLDQSIQTFFSKDGYRKIYLPASADISKTLVDDSWVLGPFTSTTSRGMAPEQLKELVNERYYDDYIAQWDSLFSNLTMHNVEGLEQAARLVALITETDSPLKQFLVVASKQTTLTIPPAKDTDDTDGQTTSQESKLGNLFGIQATEQLPSTPPITDPVTLHFSPLHELLVGFDTNSSTLDAVLVQLSDLNIQLLPMMQSPPGSIDPQLNNALGVNMQKLALKADRLAEPMASLVAGLANDIKDVVSGGVCQAIDAAWKTDVLPYYQRVIQSRYPVFRKGTADIAMTDFGAFFGHSGVIDTFVTSYLSGLVSKTPGQWTWIGTGSSVCLSDNTLKQLARAEDIKNTFFTSGATLPSIRFDIKPAQNMDAGIDTLFLDIGGSGFKFFRGPVDGPTTFSWPPADNNSQVGLRVEPVIPGSSSSISLSGPWSLLRLFDRGVRSAASGSVTVDYSFGGRYARLNIFTSSFNPLNSVALRNFRAPVTL